MISYFYSLICLIYTFLLTYRTFRIVCCMRFFAFFLVCKSVFFGATVLNASGSSSSSGSNSL